LIGGITHLESCQPGLDAPIPACRQGGKWAVESMISNRFDY
jgi:hypothetical protein